MPQSREEQDRLLEQQRLGGDYEDDSLVTEDKDYEDDPNEDGLYNCDDLCVCGHIREDHVSYVDECANCECAEFKDPEEKNK